jgi:hypothetical protein
MKVSENQKMILNTVSSVLPKFPVGVQETKYIEDDEKYAPVPLTEEQLNVLQSKDACETSTFTVIGASVSYTGPTQEIRVKCDACDALHVFEITPDRTSFKYVDVS